MAAISGAQTVIAFVVMGLVTVWFTNVMIRAIDILYKPRVARWIHAKDHLMESDQGTCALDQAYDCGQEVLTESKVADVIEDLSKIYDDAYLQRLHQELLALKAMKGRLNSKRPKSQRNMKMQNQAELCSCQNSQLFCNPEPFNVPKSEDICKRENFWKIK